MISPSSSKIPPRLGELEIIWGDCFGVFWKDRIVVRNKKTLLKLNDNKFYVLCKLSFEHVVSY